MATLDELKKNNANLRSRCDALEEASKMDGDITNAMELRAKEWMAFGNTWWSYGKDARQGI